MAWRAEAFRECRDACASNERHATSKLRSAADAAKGALEEMRRSGAELGRLRGLAQAVLALVTIGVLAAQNEQER